MKRCSTKIYSVCIWTEETDYVAAHKAANDSLRY
jgi:hypothetical protein